MPEDVNELIPTQEEIETDLLTICQQAVRHAIARVLEAEVTALVGAACGQHSAGRKDVRNGSYPRQVMTSLGPIDLNVPRSREHGAATATLGRYRRRAAEVDSMITAAYVNGTSTRRMSDVTRALMDEVVDKSTVSRVTRTLEADVEALRQAPITDEIVYLFLDATYLRARWARQVEQTAALVAYGVAADGHRRLLGVAVDVAESEASWTSFLESLIARGLRGVRLITADEHAGIVAATRKLFPEVKRQRCTVHLMRNVLAKAPARLRLRLGRELSRIFSAPSASEVKRRANTLRAGLGKQVPEAIECFDAGFAAATQYLAFPPAHWVRVRSTNGVERIHVEIKRRTRSIGSFPDRESCLRLVSAVIVRATQQWAYRPYLAMAHLPPASEVQPKLAA
jgi:transposase-like protein